MASLPTNFQDDVLNTSMEGKRRFSITEQADGKFIIEDESEYDQTGSTFGAAVLNAICQAINQNTDALNGISIRPVEELPASPEANTLYIQIQK